MHVDASVPNLQLKLIFTASYAKVPLSPFSPS
jgi:hypothetical protein